MLKLIAFLAVIALIVFGVAFLADANAHARQAQATIEVAQVAQTQSVTNMISILALAIIFLVLVILLIGLVVITLRYFSEPVPVPVARRPRWDVKKYRLVPNNNANLPESTQRVLEQSQIVLQESMDLDDMDEELRSWLNQ